MNVFQQQLEFFQETLTRPEGLLMVFLAVLMVIGLFISKALKWWVLAFAIWFSTFSYLVTDQHRLVSLVQPLETVRMHGRPLSIIFLAALLIPALISARGWRIRPIGKAMWAFFVFQI